ncbi:related to methylated-dna--protein-cysteine methyltransferase [Ustilago trichophora]|uniref:Related to methylated-dna--protein-cysteine methyltransferase n=1 Tax=Ustilago trichophora TaxID=86804 RepID=A0A5C3EJZ6_9BASI|nr:related to methylated-dna--protein-cysteine methyltransferase [Ustilago trichophora]
MPQVNPEIFHAKVYDITRLIPHGRVTSYGHIARLTGHPSHSRLVGSALKFLQDPSVPWHRVISSSGAIADRGDRGEAATRQAQRLQDEGVTIIHGRGQGVTIDFGHANPNAKFRVSMATFGWFPDHVHLQGYDDQEQVPAEEVDADEQRLDRIKSEDVEEDLSSDLTELSDDQVSIKSEE